MLWSLDNPCVDRHGEVILWVLRERERQRAETGNLGPHIIILPDEFAARLDEPYRDGGMLLWERLLRIKRCRARHR